MTDDRARRIRNLRNRNGRGQESDDDESNDAEEPRDEGEPASAPTATDGNGDDESDASDDEPTDEPDGSAGRSEDLADGAETANAADGSDSESGDERTIESTTDEGPDEQPVPAEPESTAQAGHQTEQLTASGSADSESMDAGGDTFSYDESAIPSVATGSTTGATRQLTPMVDPNHAKESPFGGAIADDAIQSDFVEDAGAEATLDAAAGPADGAGGVGRGGAVLEQGDGLVASTHDADGTIQMLEFYLNDNRYAVEIERISAIVEMKEITRFPRGPEAIDGVTDLRGEITAVLDPTAMLDVERNELTDDQYIVVLERDDDKQKLGIRVTDVLQAATYQKSQIDETGSVMDSSGEHQHEFINGIVKKTTDGRTALVTWLDIDSIIENTS
ncbi:chemotaxis protein CheW [Natrarchaeobaculum sulfurireducens]|uniref:Positive regulator of CheA protein activity (CheW) n=1 Tax=Natrarchaeobaculum sulfurireducens TaxID=2044521 RepID=A0A346PSP1_9EURY|nr:chemotaxis protein CheW [Natrarchaeobaculum sulfurireducens]AXR82536.1 Positive regulator of CheA protein activity (CheW) [Natrarchaeobaculum sulfurireducens]